MLQEVFAWWWGSHDGCYFTLLLCPRTYLRLSRQNTTASVFFSLNLRKHLCFRDSSCFTKVSQCHIAELYLNLQILSLHTCGIECHKWQRQYSKHSEVPGCGNQGVPLLTKEMLPGSKQTFGNTLPTCYHFWGLTLVWTPVLFFSEDWSWSGTSLSPWSLTGVATNHRKEERNKRNKDKKTVSGPALLLCL